VTSTGGTGLISSGAVSTCSTATAAGYSTLGVAARSVSSSAWLIGVGSRASVGDTQASPNAFDGRARANSGMSRPSDRR